MNIWWKSKKKSDIIVKNITDVRRQFMNNLALKRFFTKSTFHALLSDKDNEFFESIVRKYVHQPEGRSYEELIGEIYMYIGKEYRTEYFYKNVMLNKLLLKKHNYRKITALSELPIGNSKADFVLINGKGVVYEIKTELDNLERIESQIEDYYKAFTEVVIVTYKDNLEKVIGLVPETVGIMELTKRKALNQIRSSQPNISNLDYYTIFKLLRKKEFEQILIQNNLSLPEVIQFKYYAECLKEIQKINIEKLQKDMLKELKKRICVEKVEFCLESPAELRAITYFDDTMLSRKEEWIGMLDRNYGG